MADDAGQDGKNSRPVRKSKQIADDMRLAMMMASQLSKQIDKEEKVRNSMDVSTLAELFLWQCFGRQELLILKRKRLLKLPFACRQHHRCRFNLLDLRATALRRSQSMKALVCKCCLCFDFPCISRRTNADLNRCDSNSEWNWNPWYILFASMGFGYQAWTCFSEASVWSCNDGCKVAELPNQFSDWASYSIRSRISAPNWSRPKSCLYCTMPWYQNLQQHHFTPAKPENLGCFLWGPDSGRLSRGMHSLAIVWLRFDVKSSIRSRALILCKQACFWREILPLFLCRILPYWRKSWLLIIELDTWAAHKNMI